mmetsp:Transcript_13758/g.29605  ORF Transcript_13758/g.29605 Transcript_13758/m.29605 type:complete len:256 (-) Transcript_13758:725-1492(-)
MAGTSSSSQCPPPQEATAPTAQWSGNNCPSTAAAPTMMPSSIRLYHMSEYGPSMDLSRTRRHLRAPRHTQRHTRASGWCRWYAAGRSVLSARATPSRVTPPTTMTSPRCQLFLGCVVRAGTRSPCAAAPLTAPPPTTRTSQRRRSRHAMTTHARSARHAAMRIMGTRRSLLECTNDGVTRGRVQGAHCLSVSMPGYHREGTRAALLETSLQTSCSMPGSCYGLHSSSGGGFCVRAAMQACMAWRHVGRTCGMLPP